MIFANLKVGILTGLAATACAKIIKVEVGSDGLTFSPDSIKADKGDVVEFHFDGMHSVAASDFQNPCNPASSGGFFSGFLPDGDNSFFSVTIENTDAVFFYCGVPGHCQAGMVGVINQGSNTLAAYRQAASNSGNTKNPGARFGGTVGSSAVTSPMASSKASSVAASMASSVASEKSPSTIKSPTATPAGPTSPTVSVTSAASTNSQNAAPAQTTAQSQSAAGSPTASASAPASVVGSDANPRPALGTFVSVGCFFAILAFLVA